MSCYLMNLTEATKAKRETTLDRIEKALANGEASIKIDANTGALAFDKKTAAALTDVGLMDVCAYRRLASKNSPALRRAMARAEVLAGRKVNERAIASGVHSHDGGSTWGKH